ncbi:hypothetical protein [Paenibacillus sp. FSL L8-0709]
MKLELEDQVEIVTPFVLRKSLFVIFLMNAEINLPALFIMVNL